MTIILIFLLVGCRDRLSPQDLPTPITPEARATEIVLTQNAPPEGFGTISFPMIDDSLPALPGWRYIVEMEFEGVFAGTPRQTQAATRAEVWYNQLGSARRVVAESSGDLLGQTEPVTIETVQLGPDTFLVRNGVCLTGLNEESEQAAHLGAGTLIGGVNQAIAAGQPRAIINNETVWLYEFAPEDLNFPNIRLGDGGQILSIRSELWAAPEHEVVVRYYLTMDVENVNFFGSALPVSGQLIIRYDLFEIGEIPNLSVPFGC